MKQTKLFTALLLISAGLYAQSEPAGFEIDGSFRTRGFFQSRDITFERNTPVTPVTNQQQEEQERQAELAQKADDEIQAILLGLPTTLTKNRESLNYFDSRLRLNLVFRSSQYLEAVAGLQLGDSYFGGKPYASQTGDYDPNTTGSGSGGELGNASAVNIKTNMAYLNFKNPKAHFDLKLGIQVFNSPRGMVLNSTGGGISLIKKFRFLTSKLEAGALRARENAFEDEDNNGYADKYNNNENVFYISYQFKPAGFVKNEIYSYYLDDNDIKNERDGKLYWHGINNEFTFSRLNIIIHGVMNHGLVRVHNPELDDSGNLIKDKYDRHYIKGGLYDLLLSYKWHNRFTSKFTTLGSTGRPGFELDGKNAIYRGNGYSILKPGYTISNIGLDSSGGYSVFSPKNMSGMNNIGFSFEYIPFGSFNVELGYYELHSSISPHIENNRVFNERNGYRTTAFFGQEYNMNLRWNISSDFQLLFRSGYFIPRDGYNVLFDTLYGSRIAEGIISAEHKF